uniref:Flap endonuclease 1 n=1 Tax=Leersia perrieri TaxID=77586 RepID=A0A0D9W124_9ORYZ
MASSTCNPSFFTGNRKNGNVRPNPIHFISILKSEALSLSTSLPRGGRREAEAARRAAPPGRRPVVVVMGIKGLTKLLAEHAPGAAVRRRVEDYRGRVVAIDASLSIYQFLIAVGRKGTEVLTNEAGEVTRSLKRDDAYKDLNKAIEAGDGDLIEKLSKRTVKVTKKHNEDCKKLLSLMGVPVIQATAPGEAEAQCAALCENHKAFAVASEDMDSLTFGARRFLRHLTDLSFKRSPVIEFEVSKVLEELGLTMDQFIDFCILSGCDYCENIRGIGGQRALKLIRQHGCIEEVVQNLSQTRYSVPEDWPYQEIRVLFKEPNVSTDIPDFLWTPPDEESVEKIKAANDKFFLGRCASLLLMESLGRSWDAISRALASTPFIRSLQAFIVFRNNGGCDLQRLNEMLIPNYCHTNALLELSGLELLSLRMEAIVEGSKYECLLFDLDDTLYPFSAGINLACRKNIQDYMRHHLQIEDSQIADMCLELYKEYGTTMAGLKALGYEFDNDEFHANVHGTLPYDNLRLDPVLRTLLLSIPQRKIIFTNSDKAHAEEVLRRLGLQDCFEGIICFETLNPPALTCNGPHKPPSSFSDELSSDLDDPDELDGFRPKSPILCKPSIEAMAAAIRIVNADPEKTIFFDDSVRNIASGKAAGLHTVIVGRPTLVPGADHALESIHNIKEALPEIWDGWSESDTVLASAAAETAVVA